jgi:hypothetical protein
MTLDLTDDETAALARLLRCTIDEDRYPLSPRLATLRAILARLEPPVPRPELRPPLRAYMAPSAAGRRRRG